MADQKPLFKAPYVIKDVSALFAKVAFVLIIAAIVGNNLFSLFQENCLSRSLINKLNTLIMKLVSYKSILFISMKFLAGYILFVFEKYFLINQLLNVKFLRL